MWEWRYMFLGYNFGLFQMHLITQSSYIKASKDFGKFHAGKIHIFDTYVMGFYTLI